MAITLSKIVSRWSSFIDPIFSSENSSSPDLPLITGLSSVVKFKNNDSALETLSKFEIR